MWIWISCWPLEVKVLNLAPNRLQIRNGHVKLRKNTKFHPILRGSPCDLRKFDDLWRSKYWMWRPTDFSIVMAKLNIIRTLSFIHFAGVVKIDYCSPTKSKAGKMFSSNTYVISPLKATQLTSVQSWIGCQYIRLVNDSELSHELTHESDIFGWVMSWVDSVCKSGTWVKSWVDSICLKHNLSQELSQLFGYESDLSRLKQMWVKSNRNIAKEAVGPRPFTWANQFTLDRMRFFWHSTLPPTVNIKW